MQVFCTEKGQIPEGDRGREENCIKNRDMDKDKDRDTEKQETEKM